jgi:hypothetical protein
MGFLRKWSIFSIIGLPSMKSLWALRQKKRSAKKLVIAAMCLFFLGGSNGAAWLEAFSHASRARVSGAV